MDYVIFEANGLYDFRHVILPDVFEQLLMIPDFSEAGLTCIGALEDDIPVGAVVVGFHEEPSVSVFSLYVLPDRRSQGIGSELIRNVISYAVNSFVYASKEFRVAIRLEYVLEEPSASRFRKFLTKNNFSVHNEIGKIRIVYADTCLKQLSNLVIDEAKKLSGDATETDNITRPAEMAAAVAGVADADAAAATPAAEASADAAPVADEAPAAAVAAEAAAVHCLADIAGSDADDLAGLLETYGFYADPEYCFIAGSMEDPDCLLVAEYADDEDFHVSSIALHDNVSEMTYRRMLAALVSQAGKEYPQFVLFAEDVKNIHPEVWEGLASDGGECCVHAVAYLLAEFDMEH